MIQTQKSREERKGRRKLHFLSNFQGSFPPESRGAPQCLLQASHRPTSALMALLSRPSHLTPHMGYPGRSAGLAGALPSCYWTFVHAAKSIPRHVKGTNTSAAPGCVFYLPILTGGEKIVFAQQNLFFNDSEIGHR